MILTDIHIRIPLAGCTEYLYPPLTICSWSCPALSGDARAEDVKLILGYAINRIAHSPVFFFFFFDTPLLLLLLIHPAFFPPPLSVTVTLQLILSSNTSLPTEVLCPPVISYQVWLDSLWSQRQCLAAACLLVVSSVAAWIFQVGNHEHRYTENVMNQCANASCNKCELELKAVPRKMCLYNSKHANRTPKESVIPKHIKTSLILSGG